MSASACDIGELPRPSRAGALLEVKDLTVSIPTEGGLIEAVRGVSYSLGAGRDPGRRRRVWIGQDHHLSRGHRAAAAGRHE